MAPKHSFPGVNLAINGASLAHGVPWLAIRMVRDKPEGRAPASLDRAWIALVPTARTGPGYRSALLH
jgi:hypothetical protein